MAAEGVGVVEPAGVVVVVKVQDQVTDVSVAPVTTAVRFTDCVTTKVPPTGVTDTATTLPADLPPQPASNKPIADASKPKFFTSFAALIDTFPPTPTDFTTQDSGFRAAAHFDSAKPV
jgi:hypothetical protein